MSMDNSVLSLMSTYNNRTRHLMHFSLTCVFTLSFGHQATWHPMYDLIVAGRYPDDNVCTGDMRTIDIYDANSAQLVCQLHDASAPGIISVSRFGRVTHCFWRFVKRQSH